MAIKGDLEIGDIVEALFCFLLDVDRLAKAEI